MPPESSQRPPNDRNPSRTSRPLRDVRAPLSPRERALVLDAVRRVRSPARAAYASSVLAALFRSERGLVPQERGRIAEAVHGLLRCERRLDAIVASLAAIGPGAPRDDCAVSELAREAALLVWELREGGHPEPLLRMLARASGRPVDPDLVLGPDAGLAALTGREREAVRLSFPTWLLERLVAELGEPEAIALAAGLGERPPMTLRANTLRTTREALISRLSDAKLPARPTALARDGVVLAQGTDLFAMAAFHEGLFEQMDEGSQLIAEVTAPPPRGRVLDACAGAGGKTLALAALLGGRGRVLALDPDATRLEALRRRARRAGASNVQARVIEVGRIPDEAMAGIGGPAHGFDRVLVDAPCSGLGTLRRNPEARWRLTPDDLDAFPARQREILATFAPLVAPGGRLVYATCSVLPSENDSVVRDFLRTQPDFEPVALKEIVGRARAAMIGDGTVLRVLPHVHATDGFFAAVLRRRRGDAASARQAGLK